MRTFRAGLSKELPSEEPKKVASLSRSRLVSRAAILPFPGSRSGSSILPPSPAPPPAAHFQRRQRRRSLAGSNETKRQPFHSTNTHGKSAHATFCVAAPPFWLAVKNQTLPSQPSSLRAAPLRLGPCSCRPRPAAPCNSNLHCTPGGTELVAPERLPRSSRWSCCAALETHAELKDHVVWSWPCTHSDPSSHSPTHSDSISDSAISHWPCLAVSPIASTSLYRRLGPLSAFPSFDSQLRHTRPPLPPPLLSTTYHHFSRPPFTILRQRRYLTSYCQSTTPALLHSHTPTPTSYHGVLTRDLCAHLQAHPSWFSPLAYRASSMSRPRRDQLSYVFAGPTLSGYPPS
ncbi:hypothetical protein BGZ61DRAFT_476950 [Ilyonectria robusta]|uniref:uncharacterized protein n=1 Tax=Ilyonectria robusta TaxID=1079257 RepID=UPI001E8D75CC|nr:uncharacterized protein BGZ61DRAFT_476950 [Ilyonectria robusta]KAH8706291.1 hypothetical protein BGZ61DRAFT_476950 [Ilyonectria robusta]